MQRRVIAAPVAVLGEMLDRLAGPNDTLWPHDEPLWLDRPLDTGANGGHGTWRYTVTAYQPGLRVRFEFPADSPLAGYHELWVRAITHDRAEMVHILVAQSRGAMLLLWPLAERRLHQALVADLLDNAERAATGTVRRPARRSLWVQLLHAIRPTRPAETAR
ncbi:SRPBCC family protein [Actinoplanes sichuanensis]|uniref:SRPBCC family protein n=1 Tax=Actinoplanes sichuanensis TaxID=512349 RepID=A0ABW4AP50_9ACTN|nr:SRPBCC family protein [Actinoplanes sichuanensis]